MIPSGVADQEWLYRSIRPGSTEYRVTGDGLKISPSAFDDRHHRPSVDRSALRIRPIEARLGAGDGVTRILTGDVRRIGNIRVDPNDPTSARYYSVDVVYRPTSIAQGDFRDNPAHCRIEANPHAERPNHYRKIREALARLATEQGWVVVPIE